VLRAARLGDLSYGLYIYGWPVEQTLLYASGGKLAWWQLFPLALAITGMIALASWHIVEKRRYGASDGHDPRPPRDAGMSSRRWAGGDVRSAVRVSQLRDLIVFVAAAASPCRRGDPARGFPRPLARKPGRCPAPGQGGGGRPPAPPPTLAQSPRFVARASHAAHYNAAVTGCLRNTA